MNLGDANLACATALVDELVAGGMRHACLSPGSRSTPLALALARHPRITLHVHLDERSSAFFAVGIAKALRAPVGVACTSGTAAAELLPAVVEASRSRAPLFVLTADRPPRLRGTGANQTIDQVELYGSHARSYLETPVPRGAGDAQAWREAGSRAVLASGGVQPGPVHVNCPFEEPLVPSTETSPSANAAANALRDREHDRDPGRDSEPEPEDVRRAGAMLTGRRAVAVIGTSPWTPPRETVDLAGKLRWPVLAEPTSDVRRPDPARGAVLAAGQALIRCESFSRGHRPEVVLQLGANPISRATQSFVAAAELVIVVDSLNPDPEGRADLRIRCDPERFARRIGAKGLDAAPPRWTDAWHVADAAARHALDDALDARGEPTELRIARDLAASVPDGGTLFVGNSMPARDLDYAMAPRDGLRVLANRGASGIDGLVSSALGAAAVTPTVALIGDLSFVYDAGALLWNGRRGIDATFVVPNNGGGAIFSFLGQRDLPEFEPLFATPHGLDLGAVSAASGAGHERVERMSEFVRAVERAREARGIRVVEVVVDPQLNRERHDEVQVAVDGAVGRAGRG